LSKKGGKMKRVKTNCPVCSKGMIIKEMFCQDCGITMKGDMVLAVGNEFNESEWRFVMEFLLLEGNIKAVGEKMGISYPTVKNMLSDIRKKLPGYDEERKIELKDVIDDLENGTIDVFDAVEKLKRRK